MPKNRKGPGKRARKSPETLDEKLQRARETLQKDDEGYADNWMSEALAWSRQGVYNGLASEISLEPGDLHVDMGAGMMNLVRAVKHRFPESVVLGVERNTRVIRNAIYLLKAIDIVPHVCHSEFLCIDTRGQIRAVYDEWDVVGAREDLVREHQLKYMSMDPYLAGIDDKFLTVDERIKIAVDDLREMVLVDKLLGDRKIDSASMTFPGSGGRPAFEAPYAFPRRGRPLAKDIGVRRVNKATQDAIVASLAYLTERMRGGGRFLIAERLRDVGNEDLMLDVFTHTIKERFGEHFGSWDFVDAKVTQVLQKPAGLEWDAIGPRSAIAQRVSVQDRENFRFGIARLERAA